ncbi:MAG TPA: cysteine dioxygenase family protein [Fimbriimonadaceae bacterium]|jgi:predicted metal-dependent enzyme (double-stranded beta helix superfamily)
METVAASVEYSLESLIADLDIAIANRDLATRVQDVRSTLERAVRLNDDLFPAHFYDPSDTGYARRLAYSDPFGRYTVMVMVWKKGQGTPLHDHNGLWVVECVCKGKVRVTNYAHMGEANGIHAFEVQSTGIDAAGSSDFRVSPFEHHILENPNEETAVTIHVFGGAMTQCGIYEPVEGGWVRSDKNLVLSA